MNIVDSVVFQMEGEPDTVHLLTSVPSPMHRDLYVCMTVEAPRGNGGAWALRNFGVAPRICDDPDMYGVCPWDNAHVLHEGG